ncbi:M48 family metallopeptidase [Aliidiomarina maris]|uniref:Peptidase n=2 Tax=Aliidiomarina maris TaxID=531312 RepID=A0ABY0BRW4_9GAMM|nr:M48 family metallopeptidase [Aliidiomarina maris]RUO24806.1 peptidase [Aliidiomarina maris]
MSSMNFFHHQDIARRNTRLLGLLFSLAVILLVSLVALLVSFFMGGVQYQQGPGYQTSTEWALHWDVIVASAGVAMSVIGFAVLYKWVVLRPGGKVVAEHLGGRRLSPNSQDPLERKVLNVVEEMAIAANMPVPPVYMLDREPAINAFAAGYSPRDAVIGITRGCAEKLNRAQLQGVVAHEIAHILNGDMRLNIRIIAILNGILFISHAGYLLLRFGALGGGRRDGKNAALPLLGLGLLVLGAIGVLFGNIIKAAVSRQREFLADASAAQFTREPEALSGALQQIGVAQGRGKGGRSGSEIESPNADEAAHLFFGQAVNKFMSVMATHPPLEERIRRLEPSWDGKYKANPVASNEESSQNKNPQAEHRARQESFVRTLAGLAASIDLPDKVVADARDPEHAKALVLALLLSDDDATRDAQLNLLQSTLTPDQYDDVVAHVSEVKALPLEQQLPLTELMMPALKMMNAQAANNFLQLMQRLIDVDAQVSLFEWCLYQVIWRYLQGEHARKDLNIRQYKSRRRHDAQLSLSVLAHFGSPQAPEHAFEQGAEHFAMGMQLYPSDQLNFSDLSASLSRIDQWNALEKERLVKAWVGCASADGNINPIEQKLLFTLCACIGEPLPELPTL